MENLFSLMYAALFVVSLIACRVIAYRTIENTVNSFVPEKIILQKTTWKDMIPFYGGIREAGAINSKGVRIFCIVGSVAYIGATLLDLLVFKVLGTTVSPYLGLVSSVVYLLSLALLYISSVFLAAEYLSLTGKSKLLAIIPPIAYISIYATGVHSIKKRKDEILGTFKGGVRVL